MTMRNVVLEEEVSAPLATPAAYMCLVVPLGTAVLVIGVLMLLVFFWHLWSLTFLGLEGDLILFTVSAVLAVLEFVCSGLLGLSFVQPEVERFGFYLLFAISVIETVRLFLLLPISLALTETMTGSHMALQACSAVYGTVADIYFTFVVWSHIRRTNDDGAALDLAARQGHSGRLAAPRIVESLEMTAVEKVPQPPGIVSAPPRQDFSQYTPPLLAVAAS